MNYQNIFLPVNPLTRAPTINPGGLCWIKFCRWEDVSFFPEVDPLTGKCEAAIKLKPGTGWNSLVMPATEKMFSESLEDSTAGPYFKMQVTGYLAGNTADHVLITAAMRLHQYVVMFLDLDGQVRFIGDENNGADFKNVYTSGDKTQSRKRTINFLWESHHPALIINNQALTLTPTGVFSSAFNFLFK